MSAAADLVRPRLLAQLDQLGASLAEMRARPDFAGLAREIEARLAEMLSSSSIALAVGMDDAPRGPLQ